MVAEIGFEWASSPLQLDEPIPTYPTVTVTNTTSNFMEINAVRVFTEPSSGYVLYDEEHTEAVEPGNTERIGLRQRGFNFTADGPLPDAGEDFISGTQQTGNILLIPINPGSFDIVVEVETTRNDTLSARFPYSISGGSASVDQIDVSCSLPTDRVSPGEQVTMEAEVTNRSSQRVEVNLSFIGWERPLPGTVFVPPGGSSTAEAVVTFVEPGEYPIEVEIKSVLPA